MEVEILVRIRFSENGPTADECLTNVLKNLIFNKLSALFVLNAQPFLHFLLVNLKIPQNL